jgi:hypothetical protein
MEKSLKAVVVRTKERKLELRVGYVFYHRDFLNPGETCLGGTRWNIDEENKEVIFYGSSDDFGQMPSDGWESLVKDFKADWLNSWHLERILKNVLKVEDTDINNYKFKYGDKTA